MERVVITRTQFADFLADFANEVKEKRAKKLTYELWRPLYLWSKPGDGERDIVIERDSCYNYNIKPVTYGKTEPNPVRITSDDYDFWYGLDQEFEYHLNKSKYSTAVTFGATSVINSLQSLGESAKSCMESIASSSASLSDLVTTYDYDALASNSTVCNSIDYETSYRYHLTSDGIYINEKPLDDYVREIIMNNTQNEKENNSMKFGNFEFGPVDSSVRMSLYGMAIKNASGTYVAYDKATNQIMDVDIFNFEGANKFVYKMPVAISDITVGDVIVHQRVPMHVMELPKSKNYIVAIDPYHGERKEIMLTKSPFGFDFITKVVSLVDFTNSASAANPFGNLLPLLLMGDNKTDDMLPLLFMMNSQNGMAQNPMLMYALMNKGGKMDDLLPLMLMCGSPVLPTGVNGQNADSTNE